MNEIELSHRRWILLMLGVLLICLAGHLIHDLHPEHGSAQAGCCLALHTAIMLFAAGLLPQVMISMHAVVTPPQFRRFLLQSIQTPPPIAI